MKKRIIMLLLSLTVLLGALTLTVSAAESEVLASGTCGENLTWELTGDGNLHISGTGGMTSFPWKNDYNESITSVTIDEGVTCIYDFAFNSCTSLTSVTIPNSVNLIGQYAFNDCPSLTDAYYGGTEKRWNAIRIDAYNDPLTNVTVHYNALDSGTCGYLTWSLTFDGTLHISGTGEMTDNPWLDDYKENIISVTVYDGVTSIDSLAFWGCINLTSVTLPNSVTSIDYGAFDGCSSLTSITIPEGVTSIDRNAFNGCISLAGIHVDENNPAYSSDAHGVLFNKGKTALIQPPKLLSGSYSIPAGVTEIRYAAFEDCTGLTNVTIPDSMTSIGSSMFSGCTNLASVTIPDCMTSIDDSAFYGCSNLNGITIPETVTSIGGYAFYGCASLTSVTIPERVTNIGYRAFAYCDSLVGIYVDDDNPAYSNDERGILFNKDKTKLLRAPGALSGDYEVPETAAYIDYSAFWGCTDLTGIYVDENNPDYFTDDYGVLFQYTEYDVDQIVVDLMQAPPSGIIGSYVIPEGVYSISGLAFADCTAMTSIAIPESVGNIGMDNIGDCFYNCTSLTDVHYAGSEEQWHQILFGASWTDYSDYTFLNDRVHFNSALPNWPVTPPREETESTTPPTEDTESDPTEPKVTEPEVTEPEETDPEVTSPTDPAPVENPFVDVFEADYYYDPVL